MLKLLNVILDQRPQTSKQLMKPRHQKQSMKNIKYNSQEFLNSTEYNFCQKFKLLFQLNGFDAELHIVDLMGLANTLIAGAAVCHLAEEEVVSLVVSTVETNQDRENIDCRDVIFQTVEKISTVEMSSSK
jgi:hypothetical protein